MSSDALLKTGIKHHLAGRLAEADAIYRKILQEQPDSADALHVSGVLEGQKGNTDLAIELLRRAVRQNPGLAQAWRNLGSTLCEKGQFKEAGMAFQRILQIYRQDCPAHRQLGAQIASNEHLQEAVAAFNEAIRIKSDYAEAYNDLGNVLAIQNRVDEAIAAHAKAVAVEPGFAEAHYGLGNLLSRKGRMEEALAEIRRSAELKPQFAEAHLNMGNMLRQLGRVDEAIAAYRRAIAAKGDIAVAYFNMGQTLNAASRLDEALAAFAEALRVKPDYVRAHLRMAVVLAKHSRFDEAKASQARAAKLAPGSPEVYETLGEILVREQRAADAEPQFRRAIDINPNLESVWNGLGNTLQSLGRFDEASACFRRVLQLSPDHAVGFAYRNWCSTGRIVAEPAELDRLSALSVDANLPVDNRVAAGFALGKMLDDAGRYDEAFSAFDRANGLCKAIRTAGGEVFRPDFARRHTDETIATINRSYFQARRECGERSELPVFVVGMPRSGTTLVHQIAARHPQVIGAGERTDIPQIARSLQSCDDPAALKLAAKRHLETLGGLGATASRIVDKLPSNVKLLGLISLLFPDARVILCRRDPRDTCLSCYFQWFSTGNAFAFDLAHCGIEYLEVDRLMNHWRTALPLKMLEVHYEKLVADLEGESRRLIDFLGLPWDPACLEFHRAETTVLTASVWQVRQPIYQSSVGRWRNYERHLGPLIDVLGNGNEP